MLLRSIRLPRQSYRIEEVFTNCRNCTTQLKSLPAIRSMSGATTHPSLRAISTESQYNPRVLVLLVLMQ
jgi:hypothetical protein